MDDHRFDALARSISTSFTRRRVSQALGGITALGFLGVQTQDASAYCASCKFMCRAKKGKKRKSCFKKCAASRQPVVCPAETAGCFNLTRICGVDGYQGEPGPMVSCSFTHRGICKCSEPECNCTPVSGGYLSQTTCSCTPPSCTILSPDGRCNRFDTACGPVVCNGTCEPGSNCSEYGYCVPTGG